MVNGTVALEGIGQNKLKYKITAPGDLAVVYEEWEGAKLITSAKAQSKVEQRSAIDFETTVNTNNTFRGPTGYGQYAWFVDNEQCCNQPVIQHVFTKPGAYRVTCFSSQPQVSNLAESREDVFMVTVH